MASVPDEPTAGRDRKRSGEAQSDRVRAWRAGRRLALSSIFEADFGQRTPGAVLERHLAQEGAPEAAALAREIVTAVVEHRADIDAMIERIAPQYPVVQLARMDRALLRSAVGEVLHSAATPPRVAIAEWVELARTYSGDPARRLVNGVLGRIAAERATGQARPSQRPADHPSDTPMPESSPEEGASDHRYLRASEEDRR